MVKVRLESPEKFEELLRPLAGRFQVRLAVGSKFDSTVRYEQLDRMGLFTVTANSIEVAVEASHQYFSVTLALSSPFYCKQKSGREDFAPGTAHVLQPHEDFHLSARDGCRVLACNFPLNPLQGYLQRLYQLDAAPEIFTPTRLNANFLNGINLKRALARSWVKLNAGGRNIRSSLTLNELEDELIAHFVQITNLKTGDTSIANVREDKRREIAEEYLCANLDSPGTRDRLAEVAGVSIRTLSRAFSKRHGIGPLAFLKQRRLEATYYDLLGSDPQETSVTEVAMRYGFWHLSKFAIEYRRIFGESPSQTLRL